MRASKKYDSVRKIVCLLFAVILFIPLLLVGGTASAAASGWSNIDGNRADGINVNPNYKAQNTAIAEWNGEVYVAWQERITADANSKYQIRVKKYNGTGWVSVDGNGPYGLNADSSKVASQPTMAVYDDALYIAWTEMSTSSVGQIRVKKYDGLNWTSAEGDSTVGINVDPSKNAMLAALTVYKDELYAIWAEATQIRVKKYDGDKWTSIDGGGPNGLNVNPNNGAGAPAMAVMGDALYAVWSEAPYNTASQLRVKKYDGKDWTVIDGGSGLNIRSWCSAYNASLTVINNALYVAWGEPTGGLYSTDDQIRVKKFDGSTWSSIDGGGEQGINVNPGFRAWEVGLAAIDNELYAVWSENTGVYVNRQYVFKIRVKKYDGKKWTSAEEGKNGLNVSGDRQATNPAATELDGALYVAWGEWNSVEEQVRVARYLPPPPPAVNSVSVIPSTATIARGASKQLTAAVDAVGGAGTTVTWSSNDADKVAVSSTGKVTVSSDAALGPYTITATSTADNSKSGTATITVTEAPAVNGVTVTPDSANVMQGESRQLTAAVDAVGGAATTVTWSSSDASNKVAVSSTGKVTVAADASPGPYTITATSTANRSKTGTATITVTYAPAVNNVTVTPGSANVMQGESRQLTAAVDAVGGAATTVTWSSSDASNKVAVDSTGNVTVAADASPGPYTITATSTANRSKTGTAAITVTYAPAVNGVTVTPGSASVMQGESRQLTAAVDSVGGAATTVTWGSSDASNKVAVSSTGNVTVAADASPGPYTITATSTADNNKTGTSTITVTYAPAVNGVTVTPGSANVMQGESRQLTASVDAVGGAATTVTWSSSDASNKVAVSSTGNVTVAADASPGPYTITATSTADNNKKGTSTITVTYAPAVNSVTVTPESANVMQGESRQLTAAVDVVGGAATTVTWSSSDASNKVAVSSTGNVTVAADASPGPYTITATSTANHSKTGTATITVTYAPAVNSVTVTPDSANVMQGESRQLTAAVDAVGGAATTVTWSSSDASNKVAVSSTGNVTIAADASPGPYTITATSTADNNKTGTSTITVTYAPAVNDVTVTPDSASIMQGESRQLTAAVDAVGGAATTVTWSSSDASNKVAVSNTGNVTVAADASPGPYTITATSTANHNKTGMAIITVTYAPAVNGVTVTPDSANVMQGESHQLTAAVDVVGGAATTVTWSSSDASNKVAVSSTGNVTVAADASPGPYTITATSTANHSKTGTAIITVTYAPAVNSVTVTPDSANVMQGESRQLTATVDAVGGAATTVTWTSSDASNKVAVDSTGNVTVAADAEPGTYTITATSTADSSKTVTVTITVTAAPTYTIAALTNQTLTALIQGYVSGTQDAKTIPVTNIGTGDLTNLSVSISGANANDFVITQPASDLNSSESTSFTIQAKDGLSAGTYTVTVTVSADQMTAVTFTVTQSVNLPNAPANPQGLVAVGGDRQVTLNWNTVTGATYYNIYIATSPGQFTEDGVVTVTSSTYSVQNLINGTTYYFVVKAGNEGGLSAMSNEAGTTPATVPAAPTNLTATAGDGQATVTFTASTDDGGSPITGYEVTVAPGNVVVTGSSSPIVVTGLSNGTSYTFTVKAINAAGISISSAESNSVVPRSSSSGESGTPETPATTTPEKADSSVDILVNGKVENAGTATTSKRNDQSVRTVFVDQKKLEDKLAAEGQGAVVTIPVSGKSDVVIGELNGQMVKSMESKQAVVAIKTDQATYTIPAQQIQIGDIADKLGKSIALQDIKVQIEIAAPTEDTVKVVEDAAENGTFTIMVPPLDFTIRATYGDTTVDVSKFHAYVERTIAIPDGVDQNKITTGVVVEPDGTVRHVPTKIVIIEGKYYAQINSLTNSTYSVVWHPLEFLDAANHWAKDSVNDMGSRMVIDGTGGSLFSPDRDITRAEFAAILVRGLGLRLENGPTAFSDVKTSDWFSSAIDTAYAYQLIKGFEDGTFRPNDKITREQAMMILSRAMTITGLKAKLTAQSEDAALLPFEDASDVSGWALSSVADNVQAGLVSGRTAAELAPKASITRAEVAAIVQRLLQRSDLI
ncbi:Ig-like domain-containing protein [Paenibacillus contaminans]|nr:Ig-like domain-containing protein [Paenibacillus contaminans]